MEEIKKMALTILADPEIEQAVGSIVFKAVVQATNFAFTREIAMEDGTSEPGRVVEKNSEKNVICFLAEYIPNLVGALRGCQADAASARNRATETRNGLQDMGQLLQALSNLLAANDHAIACNATCTHCGRVVPIPADGRQRKGIYCGQCGQWIPIVQGGRGAIEIKPAVIESVRS